MNKIISIIMSVVLCIGTITAAYAETETSEKSEYSKAEKFAVGIGAFKEEYLPEKEMTRAEFAAFIANITGLTAGDSEKWKDEVFAEDNKDKQLEAVENAFEDVSSIHPQYSAIMAVYNRGYMHGISDNKFAPDYSITMGEAVKVFLDIVQYGVRAETLGGYPNGYIAVAGENNMLRSMKSASTETLTEKNAAILLFNTLDVPLFSLSEISGDGTYAYNKDKKQTFMTEILKLDDITGTLTDNGITALSGASSTGKNNIIVNGEVLKHDENLKKVKSAIGRKITAYYKNDTENEGDLVYYSIEDADDVLVLDAKDITSVAKKGSKLAISYDENGKSKSESVDAKIKLIYNNKAITDYEVDALDFESGTITLIPTENSTYDLMVVNKYEFMCVDKTDKDGTVYGKGKGTAGALQIVDLSGKSTDYLIISDESGNAVNMSSIAEGNVLNILRSYDSKVIDVVVSGKKVSTFTVKSKNEEDKKIILSDGENEYDAAEAAKWNNAPSIILGKTYDLSLNMYGDVVWITESSEESSEELLGVIMAVGSQSGNELADDYIVKIYTDKGEGVPYPLAKKVALNRNAAKKSDNVLAELKAACGEPVLYELNGNGEVKSVIIAAAFGSPDDMRGWYRINPKAEPGWNGTEYVSEASGGSMTDKNGNTFGVNKRWYLYHGEGSNFSTWLYYIAGKTRVFTIPGNDDNLNDEKKYTIDKKGFANNTYYAIDGFAKKKDSVEPEVLAMRTAAKGGGSVNSREAFFIKSKSYVYNSEEEENNIRLSGYYFKNNEAIEGTLDLDTDAVMIDEAEMGTEIDPNASEEDVGPRTVQELDKGDIVAYNTGSNGKASVLRILYDESTGKDFTAKNSIVRATAGYAYLTDSSGLRISKEKPESAGSMPNNTSEFNVTGTFMSDSMPFRQFMITATSAVIVAKQGSDGKIGVSKGSIKDIKTYHDTAAAGEYDKVVVLSTYFAGNFGTIIFKSIK